MGEDMMSIKLPLWLRFFLLIGVAVFAAGAGLLASSAGKHVLVLSSSQFDPQPTSLLCAAKWETNFMRSVLPQRTMARRATI
jgi:hypothetical protein